MNDDYQLEELENEAVNRSNIAKRVALAGGLLATGGAATYAATNIPTGEEDVAPLDETDIDNVVEGGSNQVHESKPEPKPQPQPQPQPKPEPVQSEEESELSFDKTTEVYENGELQYTTEEGTYDGRNFMMVDTDGDKRADIFAYDADGNGVYNEDEIVMLTDDNQIVMGHDTSNTEIIHNNNYVLQEDSEPYEISEEKDYEDDYVQNDFEDEKTGEEYSHDYAENSNDYNNHADVDNYQSEDYAYEDDVKDEADYGFDSLAENEANVDDAFDFNDSIDLA